MNGVQDRWQVPLKPDLDYVNNEVNNKVYKIMINVSCDDRSGQL